MRIIPEYFSQLTGTDPEQTVLIRGDRQALHGHVAVAVSLCKRAGVHEANLGYQLPR